MPSRRPRVASLDRPVDARGRTAIVTGATDGIGRALAARLVARGARVLLAARDDAKAAAVARGMRETTGNAAVEPLHLELSELSSVRAAIAAVQARVAHVDILVCNAGANFSGTRAPRTETPDGFEWTVGVNHFSHAALVLGLLPALRAARAARVVLVASDVHAWARAGDLADLELRNGYSAARAYAASKLANVLFARALARREPGLEVYAAHPGPVDTKMLQRYFTRPALRWILALSRRLVLLTPDEAAAGLERIALDPMLDAESGRYFARGRPARASRAARNDDLATRLWDLTLARADPH